MNRQFIAAGKEYNTRERHVCAPLFKRKFRMENNRAGRAFIQISAVGFYRLYLNGNELTKGYFAPYIANPDHIVYYDEYDVQELLNEENEIVVLLGNGFGNCNDNNIWDFEKAAFRAAPKFYLGLYIEGKRVLTTDEHFEVYNSPITFDDLRCGEWYDARVTLCSPEKPVMAESPKGKYKRCEAQKIRAFEILSPVKIFKSGKGYIYDFGQNNTGLCRLKIDGTWGQIIDMTFTEVIKDGMPDLRSITFSTRSPEGYVQRDRYICKNGKQEYMPSFTYHGFRYVYVEGITDMQATENLLEFVVIHSDIPQRGHFRCSDETVNKIQECTKRSDLSNFHYFPTDCPHREKNGWTADASLSAEQMLYNFDCVASLREWLHNIREAQTKEGMLPAIIPTSGWGYEVYNGPAWDSVLIELPYQIYRFTGDRSIISENIQAIDLYCSYLKTKLNKDCLLAFGLGDWCEAGTASCNAYRTPLEITDSLISIDFLSKAQEMAEVIGEILSEKKFEILRKQLISAFREKYILTGEIFDSTQTALALSIAVGIFRNEEIVSAKKSLLEKIEIAGGHFQVGVIGAKYLFEVLSGLGETGLAYKLITQKSFPGYGYNISLGATTLWEAFYEYDEKIKERMERKDGKNNLPSFNHHFWGSVSAWFYHNIGGLKILRAREVEISPEFIREVDYADTEYVDGEAYIKIRWKRTGKSILLSVDNSGFFGYICLNKFLYEGKDKILIENGTKVYELKAGRCKENA